MKKTAKKTQEELEKIQSQISGSTAEVDKSAVNSQPVIDTDGDGELSLAEMKALQSGKNVRELTESDFSSLQESLLAQINFDISENVETSSETRISFLPGETTKTLNFRVLEDEESEGEEMFNFLLSPTDTHTVAVENNSSLSFIIEDDEPEEHSVVTFTADTFTAKDGILTVGVSRETAEYSYITAGLKLTGINSAEKKEYEIAFQPFQKEVSVEIPVTQNSTEHRFTAELYDLKGGQEGSIMTAQAIVPVAAAKTGNKEAPDSYLDDFVDKKPEKGLLTGSYPETVTIAGVNYNIEKGQKTEKEGSNYCNLKRNGSIVGRYIVPEIGMFGKTENGSGDHTTKMEDDGNPYLYMEYDSDWAWNYGWTCMTWDLEKPNRYRALMMDVATGDNTNSSAVRLVLTANDDEPSSTAYTGSFSSIFNNPFSTFSFNRLPRKLKFLIKIDDGTYKIQT